MKLTAVKKVVIITEAAIEGQIIGMLNAQGVKGYTVYRDLAGKGAHGIRSELMTVARLGGNVRIETVVACEEQVRSIMEVVYSEFLVKKHPGIIYLEDIQVIRPEKF